MAEHTNGAYLLDTGSPHYVVFCQDTGSIDVVEQGRTIRYSDRFKTEGINVNFVALKKDHFSIRTYERGVEDETYSCGTGTVAAAIALALEGITGTAGAFRFETKGGQLEVCFQQKDHHFGGIWLTGPVKRVFEGLIAF